MRLTFLLKLDGKGRVTLPRMLRKLLNLNRGASIFGIADLMKREILLVPLEKNQEKIYEIRVEMINSPESVRKVQTLLNEHGLLLRYYSCLTLRSMNSLECIFLLLPASNEKVDLSLLKTSLEGLDHVVFVSVKELGRGISRCRR